MSSITRLVSPAVEAFVRQNETQIRSRASNNTLCKALGFSSVREGVLYAEDLAEGAAEMEQAFLKRLESNSPKPTDKMHADKWGRRHLQANQLKYLLLDQLDNFTK